jgi:heat shock protein HslJ
MNKNSFATTAATFSTLGLTLFAAAPMVAPLAGCASGSGAATTVESLMPTITQLMGDWNVESLAGKSVADMLPAGSKVPSLTFGEDGSVSGFAGVNRLMSKLDMASLAKGDFKLSPAATTMMAGPDEAMKVEGTFTKLLGQVNSAKLTDGGKGLSLSDGANELIRLVKAK